MVKRAEMTSKRVARIAAAVLATKHRPSDAMFVLSTGKGLETVYWRDIKAMAASCLTQAPDKPRSK